MNLDTFVHLPGYNFFQSYKAIRFGDFKQNYLLYITCFNMSKLYKVMDRRIVNNFKQNHCVDETFDLIEEIGGRSKRILKLGSLLEAFENLDEVKYKQRIIDVLVLQLYVAKFNKRSKYRAEYELFKKFNDNLITHNDIVNLKNSVNESFFSALIYFHAGKIVSRLDDVIELLPFLRPHEIDILRARLEGSLEEFHLTSRSTSYDETLVKEKETGTEEG